LLSTLTLHKSTQERLQSCISKQETAEKEKEQKEQERSTAKTELDDVVATTQGEQTLPNVPDLADVRGETRMVEAELGELSAAVTTSRSLVEQQHQSLQVLQTEVESMATNPQVAFAWTRHWPGDEVHRLWQSEVHLKKLQQEEQRIEKELNRVELLITKAQQAASRGQTASDRLRVSAATFSTIPPAHPLLLQLDHGIGSSHRNSNVAMPRLQLEYVALDDRRRFSRWSQNSLEHLFSGSAVDGADHDRPQPALQPLTDRPSGSHRHVPHSLFPCTRDDSAHLKPTRTLAPLEPKPIAMSWEESLRSMSRLDKAKENFPDLVERRKVTQSRARGVWGSRRHGGRNSHAEGFLMVNLGMG